jgi:hypothetical protein
VAVSELLIQRVAFGVGYDISGANAKEHIRLLIEAGGESLKIAGVTNVDLNEPNISALLTATLIIFVNDNLNFTTGETKTSPAFICNVDQLRSREIVDQ